MLEPIKDIWGVIFDALSEYDNDYEPDYLTQEYEEDADNVNDCEDE